ncbi:MAG: glycoside hydrolase family 3 N-terminal domain-containing protein [Verrucomicrobiota bacterium]|nr:glycoside hydrolase family 3 N-terminal domain-containing protein [Verrucomicrobiota bacterium]
MCPYKDATLSIDERLADLLSRMTLEEKVGQLLQLDARGDFTTTIQSKVPGSLLHINGESLNAAIDVAANTRLGIPILFADDAIHGHSFWPGATIFPTQLALACAWSTALAESVARVTACEMAATGPKWTFSPVLCLPHDLRWGRVGETFGEDTYLIGELGAAMIRGYQGDDWTHPDSVLATAKHFAGYSETQGGRDASEADISRRKLRSYFLPPFEKAARSGCMAFMTGYQSMEGVPTTANRWLLNDVLKEEWGFEGILVTDWDNVGRMVWEQRICATFEDAAILAVRSGNDLMMSTPAFYEGCINAVKEGRLYESEIDAVCTRILRLKFRLGLFENPCRSDAAKQSRVIGCAEHTAINLEAARQSLVLLQNNGILPLPTTGAKKIAVIGPNADDDIAQLGDWSLGSGQMVTHADRHPRETITTVLDGISELAPEGWSIGYAKGCSITNSDPVKITAAVELAKASDYAVVVIGDTINFIGEYKSTATLELQGGQKALLEALAATGTPLIVVLMSSKPLVLPSTVTNAAALFCTFNPGMQGGLALAEALWGMLNPSGKLTISFPRHVGQQPIFYSQVRGQHGDCYADMPQTPQFPFGFGLSYTQFAYSDLRILMPEIPLSGTLDVSIVVKNTGDRAGTEIVQLYTTDLVTSATWVQKELKRFARVQLAPGESQTVHFTLPVSELSLVNAEGKRVVEPGEFKLRVGSSSRDADCLEGGFRVTQD